MLLISNGISKAWQEDNFVGYSGRQCVCNCGSNGNVACLEGGSWANGVDGYNVSKDLGGIFHA